MVEYDVGSRLIWEGEVRIKRIEIHARSDCVTDYFVSHVHFLSSQHVVDRENVRIIRAVAKAFTGF
jgi:hypothetical protein